MLRRKNLSSFAKQIVSDVSDYFEEEKRHKKVLVSFDKVVKRTAKATGLSLSTVKRVRKQKRRNTENEESFVSPSKKKTIV